MNLTLQLITPYACICVLQTTRSDYENPEYNVKRRYNDFLWLRQQLEEKYPYLIVPVSVNVYVSRPASVVYSWLLEWYAKARRVQ